MLYANLVNTDAVEENDMTVIIKFYNGLNPFREKILKQPENISLLTKEISIMCGKTMEIKFEDASDEKKEIEKSTQTQNLKEDINQKNSEEDLLNSLDIPINIIEE